MKKHIFIRQIIAGFLLSIFFLAMMPKKILHDCFAGHKDAISTNYKTDTPQINKAGFNCHCNSIVVSSPFIETPSLLVPAVAATVLADCIHYLFSQPDTLVELSRLRGPPASIYS